MTSDDDLIANAFARFIASESAGGIVLAIAALAALIVSNSPLGACVRGFHRRCRGEVRIGDVAGAVEAAAAVGQRPVDGGVLLRSSGSRSSASCVDGELATRRARPCCRRVAALGGMVVPALIYAAINCARPGRAARLGDPGRDRHRLCARHRCCCSGSRVPAVAEGLPDRGRDHRRPRRDRRDRAVLHRRAVGCRCWRSPAGARRAAGAEPRAA